jgi:serine/threonine-protein kinase
MSDHDDRLRYALAERYTIERELGHGGMATVYLAHDLKHDRQVAIKVLRPDLAATIGAERFFREIKISARLNHPHIVPLLDSGSTGDQPTALPPDGPTVFLYYVMPYVEGQSLRDRLSHDGQLPVEDALILTREVASALSHAHDHGVIHRDIKPENIMLSDGGALVADFGIARAVSVAGGEQLTETGMAVGTPAYMSPEQATAEEVDGRSDIYSLACVLYEMLGGDPPYTGSTPKAILARKLTDPVPSLRALRGSVSPPLEGAVVKALARDPIDRFQTVQKFAEALRSAGESGIATAPIEAADRPKKRYAVYAIGSLVALIVLWLGGSALLQRDSGPAPATGGVAFGLERLAVLPFQNLTGDSAQDYLIDGLMEELTSELAKTAALEVRSRTSAMRYEHTELSLPEIGRELGVNGLVKGSVMGWGDTVRVVVQLVDAERDVHRWSREYTEPYERLPMMSGQMAGELLAVLIPDETSSDSGREARPPTNNVIAYELYRQGVREVRRYEPGFARAIELFNQAIQEDSTFALAHVGLADVYIWQPGMLVAGDTIRPRDYVSLARQAVVTALRLDPDLSEVRTELAALLTWYDYEYEEAEREFSLAIQLKPSNAWAHDNIAFLLAFLGRHDEAVAHASEGQRLSPYDPVVTTDLAFIHIIAGQCEQGLIEAQSGVRMDPEVENSYLILGWALMCLGRYGEAVDAMEPHFRSSGPLVNRGILGYAYARSGRRMEALEILRELELEHTELIGSPRGIAWVHLGLGNHDEAIAWFETAIRAREFGINQDLRLFVCDELHGHHGYEELLRHVRLEPL